MDQLATNDLSASPESLPFSYPRFLKSFSVLILPIILQELLNSIYGVVDTLFVARLGDSAVAAVGAGSQIFFFMIVTLFGLASGGSVFITQLWGAKKMGPLRQVLATILMLEFILPIPLVIVAFNYPSSLMGLFLHTPKLVSLGNSYVTMTCLGYIPISLSMVYSITFKAIGRVRTAFVISGISTIVNMLLDYLLIFGIGPFPVLGVRGAAIATVIAQCTNIALYVIVSYSGKEKVLALRFKDFRPCSKAFYKNLAKITWPIMGNELQWVTGMILLPIFYSHVSEAFFVGVQVSKQVFNFFAIILMGIAEGAGIVLGHLLGAGESEKAQKTAQVIIALAAIVAIVLGGIQALFSPFITDIFKISSEAHNFTMMCLLVYSVVFPFMALYFTISMGILRSGGDTFFTLMAAMLPLWLGSIALCALAVFVFHWPPFLIFAVSLIDNAIAALAVYIRYKTGIWRKNITRGDESHEPELVV